MVDDFDKIVRSNQIQNYPTTSKDITNKKVIFGPHLAGVRGKTVRRAPKRVDCDCVAITRYFQLLYKSVTLFDDVLFVNGIPFFITKSRKLHFLTAENMLSRTSNQLSRSLNK